MAFIPLPDSDFHMLASDVAAALSRANKRLVIAESCTSGLIAAVLGGIPGISANFCGSAVVYRQATKTAWLGVKSALFEEFSTESKEASAAIARGVLESTPEAHISLGITGHLGPDAPPEKDGFIYVSVWERTSNQLVETEANQLQMAARERTGRQQEAAKVALRVILDRI